MQVMSTIKRAVNSLTSRCVMKTAPFVDGQERNQGQHPGILAIPSLSDIANRAKPGTFVKVCCYGEYFWVQVTMNDPRTGSLTGSVATRLAKTDLHGIDMRDEVQFSYKHVLDILPVSA